MSLDRRIAQYKRDLHGGRLPKPARCRLCGGNGPLHWHGVYQRSLITFHHIVVLPIRRVLCTLCRKTYALFPDFVLKYHRYAKTVIRFALRHWPRRSYNAIATLLMDRCHRYVATMTLSLWRRRFVRSPG